ncbi:MAG TPA: alpha/beta hydrolase, partial [Mycobacterium sp.]|nr:alpha/beta hydrolase [Mycobacterium sp.]
MAPGWPNDPESVSDARVNPDGFAGNTVQGVTDHYLEVISKLDRRPAVIGHSFGGLIAQKIAGEGASVATVSIDNAPFKGVLPIPLSALR